MKPTCNETKLDEVKIKNRKSWRFKNHIAIKIFHMKVIKTISYVNKLLKSFIKTPERSFWEFL